MLHLAHTVFQSGRGRAATVYSIVVSIRLQTSSYPQLVFSQICASKAAYPLNTQNWKIFANCHDERVRCVLLDQTSEVSLTSSEVKLRSLSW